MSTLCGRTVCENSKTVTSRTKALYKNGTFVRMNWFPSTSSLVGKQTGIPIVAAIPNCETYQQGKDNTADQKHADLGFEKNFKLRIRRKTSWITLPSDSSFIKWKEAKTIGLKIKHHNREIRVRTKYIARKGSQYQIKYCLLKWAFLEKKKRIKHVPVWKTSLLAYFFFNISHAHRQ